MSSKQTKILAGALAVLLAGLACSIGTPSTPVVPTLPSIPAISAAPAATDTATSVPATAAPAIVAPAIASLPVAAAPAIQTLDMLDANNGWALTDTAVIRTADGGATWHTVSPTGLGKAPFSSFFLDTSNGWLVVMGADPSTGMLYHTTDGGVTWNSTAVPFGGGSLKFTDAQNGWELIGLSAGMSHEAVAVYRTSDGGASWTRAIIDDPSVTGFSDSLPLVGDKNGITALDSQHAWVTGAQPSDDFIYVYATQDGGTSWVHQTFSIPAGYSPAQTSAALPIFFGSSQAVLPVLLFSNNNASVFYVSQDGGQSWTATTPVPQGGFLAAGSFEDFYVWDGGTQLNASHDRGLTWTTITPNVNIKDNLVSIQFVNATTGWALTSDASSHHALYQTTDGGATWNTLTP